MERIVALHKQLPKRKKPASQAQSRVSDLSDSLLPTSGSMLSCRICAGVITMKAVTLLRRCLSGCKTYLGTIPINFVTSLKCCSSSDKTCVGCITIELDVFWL